LSKIWRVEGNDGARRVHLKNMRRIDLLRPDMSLRCLNGWQRRAGRLLWSGGVSGRGGSRGS